MIENFKKRMEFYRISKNFDNEYNVTFIINEFEKAISNAYGHEKLELLKLFSELLKEKNLEQKYNEICCEINVFKDCIRKEFESKFLAIIGDVKLDNENKFNALKKIKADYKWANFLENEMKNVQDKINEYIDILIKEYIKKKEFARGFKKFPYIQQIIKLNIEKSTSYEVINNELKEVIQIVNDINAKFGYDKFRINLRVHPCIYDNSLRWEFPKEQEISVSNNVVCSDLSSHSCISDVDSKELFEKGKMLILKAFKYLKEQTNKKTFLCAEIGMRLKHLDPNFSPKNYGYKKLTMFLESYDFIEMSFDKNNHPICKIKESEQYLAPRITPAAIQETNSFRMKWDFVHDETCCKIYIEEIIKKRNFDIDKCIRLAKIRGVPHKYSSIKMKFQNIKSICDDERISHISPFTGLENYSQQNKLAFDMVRKLHNL